MRKSGFSKRGRSPKDNRQFFEAIIYLARTGCRWRQLPAERFGCWSTVYNRFADYSKRGVWTVMFQRAKKKCRGKLRALDATFTHVALCGLVGNCGGTQRLIGKTKGGWTTKTSLLVDLKGRIHELRVDPGNCADITAGFELIYSQHDIMLLADKGYDSMELRQILENLGCRHNIPQRCTATVKLPFNKYLYKKRHIVENVFCKAKWWDRITTRRERRGDHATAWPTLFAITTWINWSFSGQALGDRGATKSGKRAVAIGLALGADVKPSQAKDRVYQEAVSNFSLALARLLLLVARLFNHL